MCTTPSVPHSTPGQSGIAVQSVLPCEVARSRSAVRTKPLERSRSDDRHVASAAVVPTDSQPEILPHTTSKARPVAPTTEGTCPADDTIASPLLAPEPAFAKPAPAGPPGEAQPASSEWPAHWVADGDTGGAGKKIASSKGQGSRHAVTEGLASRKDRPTSCKPKAAGRCSEVSGKASTVPVTRQAEAWGGKHRYVWPALCCLRLRFVEHQCQAAKLLPLPHPRLLAWSGQQW